MKDVHTEHCCKIHGCKYGDDDARLRVTFPQIKPCSVVNLNQPQSYPCEYCEDTQHKSLSLKRPHYFKMIDEKCVEVKDTLALEVSTIFRCGVNEEGKFYLECPTCQTLFTFDSSEDGISDISSLMINHGNGTCWYGRKGEKYSPTYEVGGGIN